MIGSLAAPIVARIAWLLGSLLAPIVRTLGSNNAWIA